MAVYKILTLFLLLLLLSSFISESTAQPNANEQKLLLTIKQDWDNPAPLISWSSTGTWSGVTFDKNTGQVTRLSFPNFHIARSIPASICSLKNLTYLDLSYNNLTGDFPTVLYACSALQFLDLSNNQLSGILPDDIGKLSLGMQHLNLSSNAFFGDVPSAIASFSKLKSLVLDTNGFNGSYPGAAIGGLVELEMLTLASNPFKPGPIPDELGKLTKLTYLWLSWMNLTGEIPDSLSTLTELTLFDISQNKMQGKIPKWIFKLEKLKILYLYANKFVGEIGPDITALNLVELDVSMNKLTGSIPEDIAKLKNLSILFMYYNNFTGPIPAGVGMLPNLTDIRLFNNQLSGPLPPELGKHSDLGNFEVCNNNLSGELPDTLCFNKKLFDLVLFNNSFSGVFPASLGECDTINNIMAYNNHFTGDFPEKIWSFKVLTNVMIQDNNFTGTVPSEISQNISRIEMGNNKFSGAIPSSAVGLKNFKAENNRFTGALPDDMSRLDNLTELQLAGNQLSGSIPSSIQSLTRLTSLNLSSNHISGTIPSTIGSLSLLIIIDLSNNDLTGEIPQEFNNLHLNSLNLSSNQLSGEIPKSLQNMAYEDSFLHNHGICVTVNTNLNLPVCINEGRNKLSTSLITVFSVLAGVTFISAVAIWLLILRHKKQDLTVWKMTPFRTLDFSECDILSNIKEENVIGSGGSGKVYRINTKGKVVAVKRLWRTAGKADTKTVREFDAEVRVLGEARHVNIVNLLCCISSDDTKLLVYEYMENGSLDRWLHRCGDAATASLHWPTRLGIAIDAARGLCYMHHECAQPIMHRDVKSSNILLDPSFRAKIADFGLARILVKSGEPEAKVDEKVDVYSFGVVLLELTTGRVANDGGADHCLAEWAWRRYKAGGVLYDVVDESVQDREAFLEDAVAVFLLGVICIADDPALRPSMKEVLEQLVQYDRTASVAAACRDDLAAAGGSVPFSSKGKKDGNQGKSSSAGATAKVWGAIDEDSGCFVAHPDINTCSTAKLDDGDELQTLLTIKRDWGNPAAFSSWKVRNSNSSTHCNWAGVGCTNRQVTALSKLAIQFQPPFAAYKTCDLSYNNLAGNFPTVLYACSALQYLDLSNNKLSGHLPEDIGKLSLGMQHLNLSGNAFIGDVPSATASFSKLKSLVLDTNGFNGRYPGAAIGGLVELETLTLAANPFKAGPVPKEFSKLIKLTYLWMSGMNLTGTILEDLSSLTELTMLDFAENKMEGVIPKWIWKLQKLEYLSLFENNFSSEIGPDITALNLQKLDLSMNKLTGSIPEGIANLKNLRILYINDNYLTGPIPVGVGMLPNLTLIWLSNNQLSGPLPPELGKYSELGVIGVSDNNLCLIRSASTKSSPCLRFSGLFPANLGDCNTISDIFPKKIWSLKMLIDVMIQDNNFTGTLPSEISPNILRINIGNNMFSGAIPSSAVGSWYRN
uniref:non-specific serine/threonine protein kinase n=1 Tax=Leersia perrieri TaxID=77586 RepID=A0A0D9VE02_9ORYZ